MPETLGGFEIASGGVCRICRYDRLVLVAGIGTCLTCARDELDEAGVARQMPRTQTRRTVRTPVTAPPDPARDRAFP